MNIEQPSDRNMTRSVQNDRRVSDMIDLQKALVADHIAGLQRDAAALRAERANARATHEIESTATEPVPLPLVRPGSPRVRIGRWLVAVGTAIVGTTEPVTRALEECAGDEADTLSHAA